MVDPTKEDGVIVEQYYGGSDPHKDDGEIVEESYICSNPRKEERYSTSSEESAVLERHPDPQFYIRVGHKYSKYWPWSRDMMCIFKKNLKTKCNLMLYIPTRGSVRLDDISSSLHSRYGTDSCTILRMVIRRLSRRCTVLIVLLARALNYV